MSKFLTDSCVKKTIGSTYVLLIYFNECCQIMVGRLDYVNIDEGYYVYVGSAKKSISTRLIRHLKRKKKKFWHIDYILSDPYPSSIVDIWTNQDPCECVISEELSHSNYCKSVRKGFGSSDCQCTTHFFKVCKGELGTLVEALNKRRFFHC